MSGAIALAAATKGNRVAWIAPTYKQSRPMWRWCEAVCAGVDGVDVQRSERIIDMRGGGMVAVYSADAPDVIRGEAFHLAVLDEAARIAEEAWIDVIQPTLADFNGDAILISTPKGRNWFWREFVLADGKDRAAFTAPSHANPNPNIKRAYELARERVPDRTFRQEWNAEFVDSGGGVFRNVRACATAPLEQSGIRSHTYVGGIDWGRTNDATVFSIINTNTRKQAYVDRMTKTDFNLQLTRLRALHERFHVGAWLGEYNAIGGPQVERMQAEGLPVQPFTTTNATKAQIIDALALAFEQRDLSILADETQINELEAYESKRTPSGLMTYSAPEGMHDDTVIALALAWHAANGQGGQWGNL